MNQFKTFLLLGGLTLLLVWLGWLLGGQNGMLIAFAIALAMNFFSYWFSDSIVLKAYKAKPLSPQEAPELYEMVRSLSVAANLPMPRVCLIPSDTPNAFATGRNPQHAVVAVTQGIVNLLSPSELRGVLAHELSHVKNRDILVGSIAATMAGAIMLLANMARFGAIFSNERDNRGGGAIIVLLLSILAPLGAMLIQMAVSRSREYLADASGAVMSNDPLALASALNKLEQYNQARPMPGASLQTAHMFTVSPLHGGGLARLFSTHPPISQRVERLRQMAGLPVGHSIALSSQYGQHASKPQQYGSKPRQPGPAPEQPGKIDWS